MTQDDKLFSAYLHQHRKNETTEDGPATAMYVNVY